MSRKHRLSSLLRLAVILLGFFSVVGLSYLGGSASDFVFAADFHLDGPTIEMRRIQYCEVCDRPLMVTSVSEGAAIRCPYCDSMQRRLPTRLLEVKVYQVCPRCGSRLDASNLKPGAQICCGKCGLYQTVLPEAVPQDKIGGTGRKPGAAPLEPAQLPVTITDQDVVGLGRRNPVDIPGLVGEQKAPIDPAAVPPPPGTTTPSFLNGDKNNAPEVQAGKFTEPEPESYLPSFLNGNQRVSGGNVNDGLTPPPPANSAGRTANSDSDLSAQYSSGIEPLAPNVSQLASSATIRNLPDDKRVAAMVNEQPVFQREVDESLNAAMEQVRVQIGRAAFSPQGQAYLAKRELALKSQILDALVGRELILQAAAKEGCLPETVEVMEKADALRKKQPELDASAAMKQARINLVISAMRKRHAAHVQVTPATVRAMYEKKREMFMQPASARLQMIVIYDDRDGRNDLRLSETIVQEAAGRLANGDSFSAVLSRYSEGPFAASGGLVLDGQDGMLPVKSFARPLRAAFYQAVDNKGGGDSDSFRSKVVGPVKLSSSWVIAKIDEYRAASPLPLQEVGDKIAHMMQENESAKAFDEWVDSLRQQAQVIKR